MKDTNKIDNIEETEGIENTKTVEFDGTQETKNDTAEKTSEVENDVSKSVEVKVVEKVKKPSVIKKIGLKKLSLLLIISIAIIFGSYQLFSYLEVRSRVPSRLNHLINKDTEVSAYLENGILVNKIVSANANLRTSLCNIDKLIDKSDIVIDYEFFDNSIYLNTLTEEGDRQTIIFVGNQPLNTGVFSINDTTEAINNPVENVIEQVDSNLVDQENEEESYTVYQKSKLYSLYKEGMIFISQNYLDESERNIDVYNDVIFNARKSSNKFLSLKGLNPINIDNIDIISGKSVLAYSGNYNMIRLVDAEMGNTVLFISSMYNGNLGNTFEKLEPYKDYNNVYKDTEFSDNSKFGYGGFSIQTDSGMYYFKIGEVVENPEEFMDSLIEMFNVKPDDNKIDILYSPFEANALGLDRPD